MHIHATEKYAPARTLVALVTVQQAKHFAYFVMVVCRTRNLKNVITHAFFAALPRAPEKTASLYAAIAILIYDRAFVP